MVELRLNGIETSHVKTWSRVLTVVTANAKGTEMVTGHLRCWRERRKARVSAGKERAGTGEEGQRQTRDQLVGGGPKSGRSAFHKGKALQGFK